MSCMRLAFSSSGVHALSSLGAGECGVVADVRTPRPGLLDRLFALGVTPGAAVVVLQTFPGVVFLCDQTELAVERSLADAILVRRRQENPS